MKKECKDCPFLRTNEWRNGGIVWKMAAIKNIEDAGNIFACHVLHPKDNVFMGNMVANDCAGFHKMQENMKNENKHPEIVNNILETNPQNYDFVGWAVDQQVKSRLFPQQALWDYLRRVTTQREKQP